MVRINCDWCGKVFDCDTRDYNKYKHHFCCRQCYKDFKTKAKNPDGYKTIFNAEINGCLMSALNRRLNPTMERREYLHQLHWNKTSEKKYREYFGGYVHRVAAELKLGRPLRPEEVVHHEDGNTWNNDPDNIYVFATKADHSRYHTNLRYFIRDLERLEAAEKLEEERKNTL